MCGKLYALKIGQTSLSTAGGWCYLKKHVWFKQKSLHISATPRLMTYSEAMAIKAYWQRRDPGAQLHYQSLQDVALEP